MEKKKTDGANAIGSSSKTTVTHVNKVGMHVIHLDVDGNVFKRQIRMTVDALDKAFHLVIRDGIRTGNLDGRHQVVWRWNLVQLDGFVENPLFFLEAFLSEIRLLLLYPPLLFAGHFLQLRQTRLAPDRRARRLHQIRLHQTHPEILRFEDHLIQVFHCVQSLVQLECDTTFLTHSLKQLFLKRLSRHSNNT